MSKLIYYLVILPISNLPYRLLYLLSDFLFFVLHYIIPYRKKVVIQNMALSFPEKSEKEIRKLCKEFYKHFADIVVESLKNFSISEEDARERMVNVNPEVMDKLFDQGRNVSLCGGHFNNWELWAVASGMQLKHPLVGIYKKLSDPYFDKKMRESRSKFGMMMVPTKEVAVKMKELENEIVATVYGFDQSPSNAKKGYWLNFLGRETCSFFGPEKNAVKYNTPVVYGTCTKVKRGYYEVRYELLLCVQSQY